VRAENGEEEKSWKCTASRGVPVLVVQTIDKGEKLLPTSAKENKKGKTLWW